MENLREHYEEVFASALDEQKLGDIIRYAIAGPVYVPHPQGMGLTIGWSIMMTLKHNVLIGKEDIALQIPVNGMLPPDEIFKEAAKFLLENARNERHKMSTTTPEDMEGVINPSAVISPKGVDKDMANLIGKEMANLMKAGQAGFTAKAEGRKVGGD